MLSEVTTIYAFDDAEKIKNIISFCSDIIFIDRGSSIISQIEDKISASRRLNENLISSINQALRQIETRWVFIISDDSLDSIKHLEYLVSTAKNIPRLASLSVSESPGLTPVNHNSIFGTIYPSRIFKDIRFFNSSHHDYDKAALEWAESISLRGWIHMETYIAQNLK